MPRNTLTILRQCIAMIADDLEGMPLELERPGKEDLVLLSSQTYSNLIARIHELEQAAMTDEGREAEHEVLLGMLDTEKE